MAKDTSTSNDFDPTKIATTFGKHDQDIIDVRNRVEAIEKKFGNNEKIAETLFETSQKQIKMEEMFSAVFKKLIEKDSKIKGALENLIQESQKKGWKLFLSQGGKYIWGATLFILGVVVTALIQNWIKR